jgi:photosystem II stability/assembly factor-like uncharacterized protein
MTRSVLLFPFLLVTLTCAHGQWALQESHTTADLRGIHSLGNGVAWASGTGGTVLRTANDGKDWSVCSTPTGAEKLDFRGIQAFDAQTAIVMSSGKGDISRLYKTSDGCKTWKLLFTNPDTEGFWDAVQFIQGTGRESGRVGYLAGDPVRGSFAEFITYNYGQSWAAIGPGVGSLGPAKVGEALFAASNSALQLLRNSPVIVTGGTTSRLRETALHVKDDPRIHYEFIGGNIPFPHSSSAGAFSFGSKLARDSVAETDTKKFIEKPTHQGDILVAVGGDYQKPDDPVGSAAFSNDGGMKWTSAITLPHGYRSAVAYDTAKNCWIAVGPNGTDISTDDGRNWHPLVPSSSDVSASDKSWNALSLPFVVGPHGRIGSFENGSLK